MSISYLSLLYIVADILNTNLEPTKNGYVGTSRHPVNIGPYKITLPFKAISDCLSCDTVSFSLEFSGHLGGYFIVTNTGVINAELLLFDREKVKTNLVFKGSIDAAHKALSGNIAAHLFLRGNNWEEKQQ